MGHRAAVWPLQLKENQVVLLKIQSDLSCQSLLCFGQGL